MLKIWAGDGEPDTFRIKLWWEDIDEEHVVYDNGMNQPIGGGSIIVHSRIIDLHNPKLQTLLNLHYADYMKLEE